jgi:hypothetical protein
MKNYLWAIVVVLGIGIISCKTDESTDYWKNVTSINDIAGIWENTFSVNVPANGDYNNFLATIFGVPIPKTTVLYENYKIEYMENSSEILVESKIVYDKLLEDTIKQNQEFTKDSLWNNLITFYDPIKNILNVTIEKYYTIFENVERANDIDLSAFSLDNSGKRLKIILPLSQTYKQEIILYKK